MQKCDQLAFTVISPVTLIGRLTASYSWPITLSYTLLFNVVTTMIVDSYEKIPMQVPLWHITYALNRCQMFQQMYVKQQWWSLTCRPDNLRKELSCEIQQRMDDSAHDQEVPDLALTTLVWYFYCNIVERLYCNIQRGFINIFFSCFRKCIIRWRGMTFFCLLARVKSSEAAALVAAASLCSPHDFLLHVSLLY